MVRGAAGREGAARKGERAIWDIYFSSKSLQGLLVFSKVLDWREGVRPSVEACVGCQGRSGCKIWRHSGKRVS